MPQSSSACMLDDSKSSFQNSRSTPNLKRIGCNVTSPRGTSSPSRRCNRRWLYCTRGSTVHVPRRQATVEMPEVLPKTTIVGRAVAAQNKLHPTWHGKFDHSAEPKASPEAGPPEHPTSCTCFLYSAFWLRFEDASRNRRPDSREVWTHIYP